MNSDSILYYYGPSQGVSIVNFNSRLHSCSKSWQGKTEWIKKTGAVQIQTQFTLHLWLSLHEAGQVPLTWQPQLMKLCTNQWILPHTLGSANCWTWKEYRIIGNNISSNISTHSYHLDFRFSCCDDSAESLALVDLETCQIGAYHHSCEKQNLRSPLIWLPRDKVIEVVSWGCQNIRSIVPWQMHLSLPSAPGGNLSVLPNFHRPWGCLSSCTMTTLPTTVIIYAIFVVWRWRGPPLAQVNTKYNIVLCPPEIVHHLKYLRCFILFVKSLRVAVSSKFPPSALIIEFGLYIHISKQQMTSVAQLLMARKYSDGYRSHWWSLVLMWQ